MTPAADLLAALEGFLRSDVQNRLSGVSAYQARIATSLLAMLQRELEFAPQLAALENKIADIAGVEPSDAWHELALALRDGQVAHSEELIALLRTRALLRLQIDNPKYSGLLQAQARWNLNEKSPNPD